MKSRNCSLNCFYSRNLLRLKRKLEVKEDKKSSLEREKYRKTIERYQCSKRWPKYVTGTQKGQDSIFPHESYLWGKRESPALDFNNQDQGYEQTLKRQHLKSYHVCCCRVFQATVWLKQFWNQDIPVVQTDLIFFTKQIQIQILCNSEHYVRTLLGMGRKRGRSIRLTQEWKTSLAIRT